MLQANEIEQRFNRVEQAIGQAAQTCQANSTVSRAVKDCIQKLDRQTGLAKTVLQSHDESRIRACVDELEMLGDEARRACRNDGQATPKLKEAVTKVHDELSDLKHQLH